MPQIVRPSDLARGHPAGRLAALGRLGEGSGAVAAVPVVRSAAALLRDVALLTDLAG